MSKGRFFFFQFPRSPGNLTQAQTQFPGNVSLGHPAFNEPNKSPAGGNIIHLIFGEQTLKKTFYQIGIVLPGQSL